MIYVYCALAALLIYFSVRSLLGGIEFLRFFRERLSAAVPTYTPFVSVIAPCRGVDPGMEQNLSALVTQDLADYEVIFVVDDLNDPAVTVINSVVATGTAKSKLVIAEAARGCSQKVENLREAVINADERSQAFVFIDSDTRPAKDWLRHLVGPLEDASAGAATGYRWFISQNPSFSSELRSVWNASIASALGPNTASNFCWGGSMAMRRDTFEKLNIRDKWAGTLSDDFAVTRALRVAGLPIVFVPQALTASVENCSFSELIEFTTRQMKITRVYAADLWILSFIGSGLFILVMASSLFIAGTQSGWRSWFAAAVFAIVSAFSIGKAALRLKAVRLALPQYDAELRLQSWTQYTLWILSPAIFLYNCIAALLSRRLTWRGTTYELKSPTETVIIGGESDAGN